MAIDFTAYNAPLEMQRREIENRYLAPNSFVFIDNNSGTGVVSFAAITKPTPPKPASLNPKLLLTRSKA